MSYQLIAIDNRQASRGLCVVYNESAERARDVIVCFNHEELKFLETDWRLRVIDHSQEDVQLGTSALPGPASRAAAPRDGWRPARPKRTTYACTSGIVMARIIYFTIALEVMSVCASRSAHSMVYGSAPAAK